MTHDDLAHLAAEDLPAPTLTDVKRYLALGTAEANDLRRRMDRGELKELVVTSETPRRFRLKEET